LDVGPPEVHGTARRDVEALEAMEELEVGIAVRGHLETALDSADRDHAAGGRASPAEGRVCADHDAAAAPFADDRSHDVGRRRTPRKEMLDLVERPDERDAAR
jgi:hypothetical protein